jgi:signal transduction histidine kinase
MCEFALPPRAKFPKVKLMKEASIPENEEQRLRALLEYEVLDTEPEPAFDAITKLAREICQKPIALIRLIDSERQWFKSKVGLDAEETPRNVSFCGHVIHGEDLFEIEDSSKDERFHDNPLVVNQPNVVFYAGQPLNSPEGFTLGTLCVIDQSPGKLTDSQKENLRLLAEQVVALLEFRKRNQQLRDRNNQIRKMSLELDDLRAKNFEARRLASLGTMAGGLAHEVNNPLGVIQLLAVQLKAAVDKPSPDRDTIRDNSEKIINTTNRISSIITSMKNIYRKSSVDDLKPYCIQKVYEDAINIMRTKLEKKFIGLSKVGNFDQYVLCNPSEISQILMNLIGNSIHAIENQAQPWIRIEVTGNENKTSIAVVDSGSGISKELQNKIFDPFFTTKAPGVGTGDGAESLPITC